MPGSLKVAAIQMDAAPTSIEDRLNRAASAIVQAAEAGAKLVVLPQQFATGYSYDDAQYEQSQTLDDAIVSWLKQQAAQHDIHIVGSLLLWDVDEVYNAALLVAPDGQHWRYDQQFPFLWERALFRDGERILVAQTLIGRIGILVGWDALHPELWMCYAAHIDLMVVLHAMPDWAQAQLQLEDGQAVDLSGVGGLMPIASEFDADIQAQARWMGVPLVMAGTSGTLDTRLPLPRLTLLPLSLAESDLWGYLEQAHDLRLQAPFSAKTGIYDARGGVIAQADNDGDQVITATLNLPERMPMPQSSQPDATLPQSLLLAVDALSAAAYSPVYQRSQRRQWGARMAPTSSKTRIWLLTTALALLVGFLSGITARRLQR